VFTARYGLGPYVIQIRFVFKGLIQFSYPTLIAFGADLLGELIFAQLFKQLPAPNGRWISVPCSQSAPSFIIMSK